MNSALRWKLIAGFVLVFLAGGAIGAFVSAGLAHRFMFAPHSANVVAQAMKKRLQWQLHLTDEQIAKISPLIDKAGAELVEIRGDTGRRVRDTFTELHREITPFLTPEQQQRLKQMEERRRHWIQQHHGPWHRDASATPEASPQ